MEKKTDSELGCEEAARLTVELQDGDIQEEEDEINYNELPPPPDGGYGWVIVIASFLCNMIVDGIAYTFGVFLDNIVKDFKENGPGKVALVGSLLSGMYLTAGPVVSALANRFGCRAVCIAGSILASVAFVLSTFSQSVEMLMITYGVCGGVGFGMIYLPAVVAVGYYFEKKRSLATGIAVCGSGFGTFIFAPLATYLLEKFEGWRGANLVLAGIILSCAMFGALMRPLTYPKKSKEKPLMQRMYEEKRLQMERGSITGSYFTVTMPDGTTKQRLKTPLNADPGVHSSLALDEIAQGQIPPVATLPTINETKAQESNDSKKITNDSNQTGETKPRQRHTISESDAGDTLTVDEKNIPRNASQPVFSSQSAGIPKNGSVPSFNRTRKSSENARYQPSLGTIKASSRGNVGSNGDVRNVSDRNSRGSIGSKYSEEFEFTSKSSLNQKAQMVPPLMRKDIFYSGSVTNLKEYQSQKSLTDYRNSVISLTRFEKEHRSDVPRYTEEESSDICPCLYLPPSFKAALSSMLDVSLLKDPAFMLIGISNLFGMAALYIPFFYLVDYASKNGIDKENSSLLLSIIGITNTFARILFGYISDFPSVDSLFMNNLCLVLCTVSVGLTPFCSSFTSFVIMSLFFGLAIAGYISLTSIILVDLLGLEKLTNAFGLLILFRGVAAIIGTPFAGALFTLTGTYDLPFFVAGGLFGLSALSSFLAPVAARCKKQPESLVHVEVLTPIEENDEDEDDDNDQPITMIPKIFQTAPSPTVERSQEMKEDEKNNGKSKELSQMESVL
ncbi:CLUMA_CG000154, isoform B [Clunio marinus]|uniref:CLUMA_CG000154, isoform B n=1 Tax=Clunio marinus TaxID=568069 RepID=A0A1J1HE15_9DIPT|nr:CLUMA_CG000154, isoform B [Clunio marinus]